MAPLPIVICGKNPNVAKNISAGLLPEYDAIHVITSAPAGVSDIPVLLSGKEPSNTTENIGSKNYAAVPVAVVVGGGYTDEEFAQMHEASGSVKAVPWLKADNSILKSGLGPPTGEALEAFVKKITERVKTSLGEIGVGKEGVEGKVYDF